MESVIIKEIESILKLPLCERKSRYYQHLLKSAKKVKIVRAADVLSKYELNVIRKIINPQPKQCYRNAHLLCVLLPGKFEYCEGKVNSFFPIKHAFNKVGDSYIDITFEFALNENPCQYEYVSFGEYDAETIEEVSKETGYYGDVYRYLYNKSIK